MPLKRNFGFIRVIATIVISDWMKLCQKINEMLQELENLLLLFCLQMEAFGKL